MGIRVVRYVGAGMPVSDRDVRAVREHRLLCQRRLRTKTLEISPESLCGGIVPPTIAYPDIVRIESSPRVPLVGAS